MKPYTDHQKLLEVDKVLTPADVAALLGLHLKTIYKLADKGMIPGVRIGKSWRFKRADVEALITTKPAESQGITMPRTIEANETSDDLRRTLADVIAELGRVKMQRDELLDFARMATRLRTGEEYNAETLGEVIAAARATLAMINEGE